MALGSVPDRFYSRRFAIPSGNVPLKDGFILLQHHVSFIRFSWRDVVILPMHISYRELCFCCDYQALNRILKKDWYPLPLIQETLNQISKTQWLTKLDVIAMFHRIHIAEDDQWLTAFRTCFGLFEWLVTLFGLANTPSMFQQYINWTLRDFIDDLFQLMWTIFLYSLRILWKSTASRYWKSWRG